MHHPTDRIIHTTAFVKPVVEHWLELEIVKLFHPMKDRSDDPSHHERTLLPRSYISLVILMKQHLQCIATNIVHLSSYIAQTTVRKALHSDCTTQFKLKIYTMIRYDATFHQWRKLQIAYLISMRRLNQHCNVRANQNVLKRHNRIIKLTK